MTNVVLCPNCGGQKTVSKPPYIAGDVNSWGASGTPTYPCPMCDGRGWIRVDSVSQEDFDDIKIVALSVMETAENLMDECIKRADRIKELETELEYMVAGERAAEEEIERLCRKILDIEGREDLVTTELEHRADVAEKHRDNISKINMKNLAELGDLRIVIHELEADMICFRSAVKGFRALVGNKDLRIADLESQRGMVRKTHDARVEELLGIIDDLKEMRDELLEDWEAKRATVIRDKADLELLDEMLKIVNPIIQEGEYIYLLSECHPLSREMWKLCQTVVQYRRKHDIVG